MSVHVIFPLKLLRTNLALVRPFLVVHINDVIVQVLLLREPRGADGALVLFHALVDGLDVLGEGVTGLELPPARRALVELQIFVDVLVSFLSCSFLSVLLVLYFCFCLPILMRMPLCHD